MKAADDIGALAVVLREWTKGYCSPGGARAQRLMLVPNDRRIPEGVHGVHVERRQHWFPRRVRCHECGGLIDHGQARLGWWLYVKRINRTKRLHVHHRKEDCK